MRYIHNYIQVDYNSENKFFWINCEICTEFVDTVQQFLYHMFTDLSFFFQERRHGIKRTCNPKKVIVNIIFQNVPKEVINATWGSHTVHADSVVFLTWEKFQFSATLSFALLTAIVSMICTYLFLVFSNSTSIKLNSTDFCISKHLVWETIHKLVVWTELTFGSAQNSNNASWILEPPTIRIF